MGRCSTRTLCRWPDACRLTCKRCRSIYFPSPGHKLYGPQGAGALYLRAGVELVPLLAGGGQEFRSRSGTQALPSIAGFGLAAELAEQEMQP